MRVLPVALRRQLENAIKQARRIAEGGARKAIEALAVHEPDPYRHMDEAQRDLRRKLRAQARQLGEGESLSRRGAYEIKHLVEKLARPMAPSALRPLFAGEWSPHLARVRGVRVAGRLRGACAITGAQGCMGCRSAFRCQGITGDISCRRPGGRRGVADRGSQFAYPAGHWLVGRSVHRQR
jgi:hypothetical protein